LEAAQVRATHDSPHPFSPVPPAVALKKLLDGNRRYVAARLQHPHQTPAWRKELTKGQHPFACILACSDSRVPPEIVFDEGLGDLFVVRVAGNVVDDDVIGSLEYAVEHLGSTLILVMGHQSCGAVTAALGEGEPHTHIQTVVDAIRPAVDTARKREGDLLTNAIEANVRLGVRRLSESGPLLSKAVETGTIKILGGLYQLDTGVVQIL
jgi:carbonic anhydrase